jgi:hypothetical protein
MLSVVCMLACSPYVIHAHTYVSINIVAGLRNQIRLVGVYAQLVGLRFPL